MSEYPVMLHGDRIHALVVGAGAVAARKITSLIEAGARVRVVAPEFSEAAEMACGSEAERILESYRRGHIADANIVIAATQLPAVNREVAHDARALGRLVSLADDSADGDFASPAHWRNGPLTVSVYAGGLPAAAARIRDFLAASLPENLAATLESLIGRRRSMLAEGRVSEWREISRRELGEDFIARVQRGEFEERGESWR